jgi:sugar lactone lactonase YvrE
VNRSPHAYEIEPTPAEWKIVVEAHADVGEGPTWSVKEQALYFVDIPACRIYRHSPHDGSTQAYVAPQIVTAVVPCKDGRLLVSLERSVIFLDPHTGAFGVPYPMIREPNTNRFNDAKCDRRGRFFAGTMSKDVWDAPVGTLYRYGVSATPEAVLERIRCSNGLGWSPESTVFYFVESFAHTIWAFDYDVEAGSLKRRRKFATLDPDSGAFPDGLTVDAEGFVWSAQPVFGRLVRYAPDGSIDRIIEAPVSRPTSCAFGGADLSTLYVTSAHNSLDLEQLREEPLAGALLSLRPGVKGIAETPFAGESALRSSIQG